MTSPIELFPSAQGVPTARHRESGVLLHSERDPMREARSVAHALCEDADSTIWIIGDGLGYLSGILRKFRCSVQVIEPFFEISNLGHEAPELGDPTRVRRELAELARRMQGQATKIYIAPYVRALIHLLPSDVADTINEIAVLSNSRNEYAALIRANIRANAVLLKKMPRLEAIARQPIAIACGSGPSLRETMKQLPLMRDRYSLIACSSAVPVLQEDGFTPDWTIALEAHEGVARDLEALPSGAPVVVFEWTDPQVMDLLNVTPLLSSREAIQLETGGGTTLLTAADLASRIALREVFLVGADLSWSQGLYADGAVSKLERCESRVAPKFSTMRKHIEQWIAGSQVKLFSHVVEDRSLLLKGARHVSPQRLAEEIEKMTTIMKSSAQQ